MNEELKKSWNSGRDAGMFRQKELFKDKIKELKVYSIKDKKGNVRGCILVEELLEKLDASLENDGGKKNGK